MTDEKLTPEKEGQNGNGKTFYEWSPLFLCHLAECGNVSKAAQRAGISRTIAYRHRANNEQFRKAWEDALEQAADVLEAEAWRRAVDGIEEPVGWYQGHAGGTVTRYSDTLLIFLLKAHRPDKFRERVDVKQDGEVTITVNYGERGERTDE